MILGYDKVDEPLDDEEIFRRLVNIIVYISYETIYFICGATFKSSHAQPEEISLRWWIKNRFHFYLVNFPRKHYGSWDS